MKGFRSLVAVMCVGIAVSAAACSSADSTQPDSSDVTSVTVMVADPASIFGSEFGPPSETVNVVAAVLDGRDQRINRSVDWSLQLVNGKQAGDSIGSLSPTGPLTARVVFRRPALVAIVASVAGSDGARKSGTLYLTWP